MNEGIASFVARHVTLTDPDGRPTLASGAMPIMGDDAHDAEDAGSDWSSVEREHDVDFLHRKIAALQHEHHLLRNQMAVMAAFAHQPAGVPVHAKATVVQAAERLRAARTKFIARRAAAIKVQAAYRRHEKSAKWRKMLDTFPERTKSALLSRALQEKERADVQQLRALKEKARADPMLDKERCVAEIKSKLQRCQSTRLMGIMARELVGELTNILQAHNLM